MTKEGFVVMNNLSIKDKKRGERRKKDYAKAIRKRNISRAIYTTPKEKLFNYYPNLHQYSKNKIHCSCEMCADKTNTKAFKGKGPSLNEVSFNTTQKKLYDLFVTTNYTQTAHRNKKNWSVTDKRKVESMQYKLKEYFKESC